jgi:hypothetical protein
MLPIQMTIFYNNKFVTEKFVKCFPAVEWCSRLDRNYKVFAIKLSYLKWFLLRFAQKRQWADTFVFFEIIHFYC